MQGIASRRYLTRFDTRELPLRWADVLVLGSGVAGLSAALHAADRGLSVLVATKSEATESNTNWAQGGIAAIVDPAAAGDSYEDHIRDTEVAGVRLCDTPVVEFVVRESTQAIKNLIEWGAEFDKEPDGELSLTKEGGHSARRILHAAGDATGKEIQRACVERTRNHPRIRFLEHAFVIDLITSNGECQGALVWDHGHGMQVITARATILAAGGAGRVFRETTNPRVATGDGIAMAYRAGCTLSDMEFMQFHPTTLYVAGAARMLLTEALRGEGAYLVDADGVRFMQDVHELAELAPRDIVARAIVTRLRDTNGRGIFLDLRHLEADALRARFPGIDRICRTYGLDFTSERVPVRPSAHYTIGGVKVDHVGQTSIPRLFAIGEVSCSGLHGANRLASNSLLEGMVFGARAGEKAAELAADSLGGVARLPVQVEHSEYKGRRIEIDIDDMMASVRALTWRDLAIERDGAAIASAFEQLKKWCGYVLQDTFAGPRGWELQNLLSVATHMAQAALWRKESRGAHHRLDHPETNDAEYLVHSEIVPPERT